MFIVPDRLSLDFSFTEHKLMDPLWEPHDVGTVSVSGNCCPIYYILLPKQAKDMLFYQEFLQLFLAVVPSEHFGLMGENQPLMLMKHCVCSLLFN